MRMKIANPPSGLTRPRLYKKGGKFFRGKKSKLPSKMRLANPKKRRKHRFKKRHVKRASFLKKVIRRKRSTRQIKNPFEGSLMLLNPPKRKKRRFTMAKRHRKSHRRRRHHNPALSVSGLLAGPKEMMTSGFVMEAAGVAAGFVLPGMVMNFVPAAWKSGRVMNYGVKVAVVAALSAVARFISPRTSRSVLIGGGVMLLLDLYTDFMGGGMSAPVNPAPGSGTNMYYGPPLMPGGSAQYYGPPGMPGSGQSLADVGDNFDVY